MKIGYARVSTHDQNLDLQLDALKKAGCEKVFSDKATGSKAERPGLEKLLSHAREGDIVVCWRLDRLGRSMKNLLELAEKLSSEGVGLVSLSESIDTTTATGRLIFHFFSALAEFERGLTRERIQAGQSAARARGRQGGRPKSLRSNQIKEINRLYSEREYTVEQIAEMFKISRMTVYRNLKK